MYNIKVFILFIVLTALYGLWLLLGGSMNLGVGVLVLCTMALNASIAFFPLYFSNGPLVFRNFVGLMALRVAVVATILSLLLQREKENVIIFLFLCMGSFVLFQMLEVSYLIQNKKLLAGKT